MAVSSSAPASTLESTIDEYASLLERLSPENREKIHRDLLVVQDRRADCCIDPQVLNPLS